MKVKVNKLKTLYKELSLDIKFIIARSMIYYNKKYSIGPMLKEGDKVYLLQKNIKTKQPSDKLDHKKLRLFTINKKTGLVNYRLKLLTTIQIYLVFHVLLLEPALPDVPPALVTEV